MFAVLFWFSVSCILYTYIGYPAALWLLTRRARPIHTDARTPTVTLMIAAHNEAAVIARKLDNSLALDYPRELVQIIVVVDGNEDATAAIVQNYAAQGVELNHSQERRGKTSAINRALPAARGEIIVFSDANNLYEPQALRELMARFADPAVGAVTGAKSIAAASGSQLGQSEGLYWRYESRIKQMESRLGTCTGATGEILAVRRVLCEPIPERIINEDFYLAMRLVRRGYRVLYAPQARSLEQVSQQASDEVARRARIVAGRYQALTLAGELLPWHNPVVIWQVVSHKFLRPLVPFAMAGALVGNLGALLWPPPATGWGGLPGLAAPFGALAFSGQFGFYFLAFIGSRLGKRRGWARLLYLPTFLVNSNFAALVGLVRFLTGRQSPLWQRARREEGE